MKKKLSDMSLAELKKRNLRGAIGFTIVFAFLQLIRIPTKSIPIILAVVIISSIGGVVSYIFMMWLMKKYIKK
jgi:hypothetical protein